MKPHKNTNISRTKTISTRKLISCNNTWNPLTLGTPHRYNSSKRRVYKQLYMDKLKYVPLVQEIMSSSSYIGIQDSYAWFTSSSSYIVG